MPDPIIRRTAEEMGLPMNHVQRVVDHYFEVLRDEVWQRGRVVVRKLASFRVRKVKARTCGHVQAPEHDAVLVRATKNWRRR